MSLMSSPHKEGQQLPAAPFVLPCEDDDGVWQVPFPHLGFHQCHQEAHADVMHVGGYKAEVHAIGQKAVPNTEHATPTDMSVTTCVRSLLHCSSC